MNQQNYQCSITANITAKEAFDRISEPTAWWTKNIEGSAKQQNDVFTVHFGDTYVTFKVIEMITGLKTVWQVTDSYLHFIKDKQEWTNTQIIWEILPLKNAVQVNMTHVGLVPEAECYTNCEKGWNFYLKESLYKLLTENKGQPDGKASTSASAVK